MRQRAIRAIALDIDGTLMSSDHCILPKTLEALVRAQAKGVRVILASGRSEDWLADVARQLRMDTYDGLLVSYNGSKVSEVRSGRTLYLAQMEAEISRKVIRQLQTFDVSIYAIGEAGRYVKDLQRHEELVREQLRHLRGKVPQRGPSAIEVKNLADFVDFPVYKIVAMGSRAYMEGHYLKMSAPLVNEVTAAFSSPIHYEFTAKGVNKGRALEAALAHMGLDSRELLAFGDAENDRAMLETAGVGIAMGNATEALKAVADEITLSNDEEGIAVALEKFLP